jgi:hypothetical protein
MMTQEMFAPSLQQSSSKKTTCAVARAPRGIWTFGAHASEFAGRKLECDEEGCESDQIKIWRWIIYIFFGWADECMPALVCR